MIQALGNSLKYLKNDSKDIQIRNSTNFINNLKDIVSNKHYFNYGLVRTIDVNREGTSKRKCFKLLCLNPRVSFDSLKKSNYRKILFTSGTLPSKDVMEFLTGLEF